MFLVSHLWLTLLAPVAPIATGAGDALGEPSQEAQREPRGLTGVGLTAEDVTRAIDRGAHWLWTHLREELAAGERLGADQEHLLAALALVHSGVHERDADFDAALRELLAETDPVGLGVYASAVLCMLIEAYGDPVFFGDLRVAARYLVEAQGSGGTWTYSAPVPRETIADPPREGALEIFGGVPLDGSSLGEPLARTGDVGRDGDNSATQFALLGLHAASRAGVRVNGAVWERALEVTRARQGGDGGWGYTGGAGPYGSMTAAGISALALCAHGTGGGPASVGAELDRGLTWLAESFSVSEHPRAGKSWHHYYLYSVERLGQILGTEFVGEHEWYPLGARWLVSSQRADGSWLGEGHEADARVATSFALLFLERATPRLRGVRRGGSGTLETAVGLDRRTRFYVILDASGSMLERVGGARKLDLARATLLELARELPAGVELALRVYGHRTRSRESGASEDTELVVPLKEVDVPALETRLAALSARGQTPLALSLERALADLAHASADRPVVVLLLTDGWERTFPRRRDPLPAAKELARREGLYLHVVGFDIGRDDWREKLAELARGARGRYWSAAEAQSLAAGLRAIFLPAPEGLVVLDHAGSEVARGEVGASLSLPEGRYRVRVSFAGKLHEQSVWINTDATTSAVFHLPDGVDDALRGL